MSQQPITIDLEKCDTVKCSVCQESTFTPLYKFKRIPGIAIGSVEDQPHAMEMMVCAKCGTPFPISWEAACNPDGEDTEKSPLIL